MKLDPWTPALVAAVCQTLGIGLFGVFSFFVIPLSLEFGVGAATINTGAVFLLLAPALMGPIAGRYIDTHSIRRIILLGVVLASVSLLGISLAASLVLVGAGFFAYAVGQSLYGPLILNPMLIKTYQENVATALSVAAMGTSVGAMLLPFSAAWLMDTYSWRETLQVLAMGVAIVLLLTVRLGLPRFPGESASGDLLAQAGPLDKGFLRAPAFWIIGIAVAIIFNMAVMVGICYAPHFTQQGFTNSAIATFMAVGGAAGFTAKILVASFVDRWHEYLKSIAVAVVAVKMLGMGVLLWGDSFFASSLGVAMIGGTAGAFLPLYPYLNSRYFSTASIGGVSGAQAPMMLPLGLVSAPLAGYAFDVNGSYDMAFVGAIAALLVAALLLATLPESGQRVPENYAAAGTN